MSCCSRPTFAISIGVLQIILYLLVAIFCTIGLVNFDETTMEESFRTIMAVILSLCLFAIAFNVNMIVGVVTKRHKMIAPYLRLGICGTIIYVSTTLFLTFWFMSTGEPTESVEQVIIRCALIVVVQCILLRPIYLLYDEWRVEAHGLPLSQQMTYPAEPPTYQCVYGNNKIPIDL